MRRYKQCLKTLRTLVRAHARSGAQPDLAALARDLGAAVRRDAGLLDAELMPLIASSSTIRRWLINHRSRQAGGLRLMVSAWPANHATTMRERAGGWCLDVVLHGTVEVLADDAVDRPTGPLARTWLARGDAVWFDAGDARRYRCRNLSRQDSALLLHVHGGGVADVPDWAPARVRTPRLRITPAALAHRIR